MAGHILVIDDDTDICFLLSRFLKNKGFSTESAHSGKFAMQLLDQNKFDLIFCDFRLGDIDGKEMLMRIREKDPSAPVIIITGYSDVKTAVDVIKLGAYNYVAKPLIPDEIFHMVENALSGKNGTASENTEAKPAIEDRKSKSAKEAVKESSKRFIEGKSPESQELYRQVDLVAPTSYSVIIYGESGTGKESIARRIHERSKRSDKPFVAVDCGALSRELAASELFGHVKGSFTSAFSDKTGHFEMANGGTLFLDEVGNLSYDIQVLLLRVVQERKMRKIGSNKEIDVDVRILVASNEKLNDSVARGKFREDLYHRFNEFTLYIPPLRDRIKDVMVYAQHFLNLANEELNKEIIFFSQEVKQVFMKYSWPGNLREMNNVIRRAVLLSEGDTVELHALPQELIFPQKFNFTENNIMSDIIVTTPTQVPINLKSAAQLAEHDAILKVLQKVHFNRTKAAKILNIDRKTLYLKMRALNMLAEEKEE